MLGSSNLIGWTCHSPFASRPIHCSVLACEVSGRPPPGPNGEVDLAVAVDIVGLDAHVVARGFALNDDVLFPGWILVPENGILGERNDVGLLVAVDVGGRHGVNDLAGVRVNLLPLEGREIGGCRDEQREQNDGRAHGVPRRCEKA